MKDNLKFLSNPHFITMLAIALTNLHLHKQGRVSPEAVSQPAPVQAVPIPEATVIELDQNLREPPAPAPAPTPAPEQQPAPEYPDYSGVRVPPVQEAKPEDVEPEKQQPVYEPNYNSSPPKQSGGYI